MNIKGLTNIQTNELKNSLKLERTIKSDSSHERDANGQQNYQEDKREHREKMSDTEFENAIEYLQKLPSFTEHRWTVSVIVDESKNRFLQVKDNLGNLIRTIPEYELWTLPYDQSDQKGQLLKKSA